MRINKKWWKKAEQKSLAENASAIAYLIWRAAQDALLDLENADFQTDTLAQRIDVIKEFLFYMIHTTDRWCYGNIEDVERQEFIIEIAKHNARTLQSSMEDISGVQDYKQEFYDLLNQRLADYSEMPFDEKEDIPSFQMRAYLGQSVSEVMGGRHNKWIQDHVVELEGYSCIDNLKKGFDSLFRPAFDKISE